MNGSPSSPRPEPVGSVVSRFLDRSGLAGKIEAASVVPEWPALVGDGIAKVTRPVRVSDGVLFVEVASSAWMMELNMMRRDLMARINAGKKKGRIEKIVFLMGGREQMPRR